ncbi:MAG: 3-dehydroquinate synthase [Candidatus Methylacidiphilales bacterium]|nr:3-dehydroquinate synthase [Candidatus Methylacidiphilales bacterium]
MAPRPPSLPNVEVRLSGHAYPIHIGSGSASAWPAEFPLPGEVAVITDRHVAGVAPARALIHTLLARAQKSVVVECPPGEETKSLTQFASILSRLAEARLSRSCTVVALGGGVVGDLAGYVAASYLRGVGFIQIPTTLLAMVDSSVGGKTGVNLPEGKNLAGAFYQPAAVFIDLDFLGSLPARERAAGMAEVIKYGIIRDPELFARVENGPPADLAPVIRRCVEIKAEVVAGDEKETTGLRAILNFGHTLGHAIEQSVGYGVLLHGEAISIGMSAACFLSEKVCGLDPAVSARVRNALRASGLPLTHPGLTYEALAEAMGRDKKATAKGLRWILCPELGKTELRSDVPDSLIRQAVTLCTN